MEPWRDSRPCVDDLPPCRQLARPPRWDYFVALSCITATSQQTPSRGWLFCDEPCRDATPRPPKTTTLLCFSSSTHGRVRHCRRCLVFSSTFSPKKSPLHRRVRNVLSLSRFLSLSLFLSPGSFLSAWSDRKLQTSLSWRPAVSSPGLLPG